VRLKPEHIPPVSLKICEVDSTHTRFETTAG